MKKIWTLFLVLLLCFSLAGCGKEYEDTNGDDDFTLQTITDENIIHLETGASNLVYKESKIGALKSAEYSSKNFNGVEQIFLTSFWGKSDVEIYIGHMNVKKGNFKLAVINNDEIIMEIPLDAFGETYFFEDLEGTLSVHVAGESAAFEFYIDIN